MRIASVAPPRDGIEDQRLVPKSRMAGPRSVQTRRPCPSVHEPVDLSPGNVKQPTHQLPDPAAWNGPGNFKHPRGLRWRTNDNHHPRILNGHTATPPLASIAARAVSSGCQLSELMRSPVNPPPSGLPSPF